MVTSSHSLPGPSSWGAAQVTSRRSPRELLGGVGPTWKVSAVKDWTLPESYCLRMTSKALWTSLNTSGSPPWEGEGQKQEGGDLVRARRDPLERVARRASIASI